VVTQHEFANAFAVRRRPLQEKEVETAHPAEQAQAMVAVPSDLDPRPAPLLDIDVDRRHFVAQLAEQRNRAVGPAEPSKTAARNHRPPRVVTLRDR
jgi:hypothetical protein